MAMFENFSAIFGITIWVLIIAGLVIFSLVHFFKVLRSVKFSIRPLLLNFGQKMWMTVGIGITFLGLYAAIVFFGSSMLDSKLRLDIFFLMYRHPTKFIYLGLFVFACISVLTLLVRRVIKNLYHINKS